MARPHKQGVDYFPLDVHMDNKFKFVEIKYGLEGFAVVIKILQNIYSQGFWCYWSEDEKLLFANEQNVDFEKLNDITQECLKRDIFDRQLYNQHKILTSKGIQKRYKEIVRRRKDVNVIKEYLLIQGFGEVNDVNNPSSSQQNDDKSTQSKVKESKVNESKENKKESKLKNKNLYGDFVLLTEDEYKKLVARLGEEKTKDYIERVDNYIGSKGAKYKSHYHTILNWVRRAKEQGGNNGQPSNSTSGDYAERTKKQRPQDDFIQLRPRDGRDKL